MGDGAKRSLGGGVMLESTYDFKGKVKLCKLVDDNVEDAKDVEWKNAFDKR